MTTYVLFGITGDLAAKKILPALSSLYDQGLLPQPFSVVGVTRQDLSDAELRTHIEDRVDLSDSFIQRITCVSGAYDAAATYTLLKEKLTATFQALFHLSVPPSAYRDILTGLAQSDITQGNPILIEKPFGTSLATAQTLQGLIEQHFAAEQIFRIDHYLAKGGVQNILARKLRGEMLFGTQPLTAIHIATCETMTVAGRVGFYDGVGALRDVLQNHLLEVLATTLMSQPNGTNAADIQQARAAALSALPETLPTITRGQYEGYLADAQAPASDTETYIRIETTLTGPFAGVTCILEGGKALARTTHTITLTYANGETERIDMNEAPERSDTLTNYGRLMFDALAGDQTLFVSTEEVMAAWEYVTPILAHFPAAPCVIYPQGAKRV